MDGFVGYTVNIPNNLWEGIACRVIDSGYRKIYRLVFRVFKNEEKLLILLSLQTSIKKRRTSFFT